MRIALFFVAFILGVGLAAGLDAADASSRHDRRQSQTVSVEVPATPGNSGGPVEVQPVRWQDDLPATSHRATSTSTWTPGAGDIALAAVAIGTVGTGLLVRRRALAPVRV